MFTENFYKQNLNFLSQPTSYSFSQNQPNKTNSFFHLAPKQIITQKQLLIDILYLILGLRSNILCKKGKSQQYQLPDKYQLTHLTPQTLKNVVKDAVRFGNQIRYIQNESKRLYTSSSSNKNAVVRTFCQAVFIYLGQIKNQYSQALCSMTLPKLQAQLQNTQQLQHRQITLLSLPNILAHQSYLTELIIRCVNSCQLQFQNKSQTVRLLDKMLEIQQQMIPYSFKQKSTIINIFKRVISMYIQGVKDWLKIKNKVNNYSNNSMMTGLNINLNTNNNINKQGVQYFIELQQDSKQNYLQSFLYRNQQIDANKLPKLMQNQSKAILQLGKTIRFISLYYESHQQQKLMKFLDIDTQFQLLANKLKCQQKVVFKRVVTEKISLNQRIRRQKQKESKQYITNSNLTKANSIINKQAQQNIETQMKIDEKIIKDNPYSMFSSQSNMFNINWIQKRDKIQIKSQQNVQDSKQINQFGFLPYIRCILLQILQNINKKCLQFFKDKTDTIVHNQPNRIQKSLKQTLIGIKKFMLLDQGDFAQQFFNSASQIIDKQKIQVSHTKIYSCIDTAIQNSSAKNIPKQILNNVHFDFIKMPQQKRSDRIKLWMSFCFNYRQDSPINYIFNVPLMEKLKQINNTIIRLKKGQQVLAKIWNQTRQDKNNKNYNVVLYKKQRMLCNSLLTFISTCLCYMLQRLHSIFNQYTQKLQQKTLSLFSITSYTNQMITNLANQSNSNRLLHNSTMQALLLIQRYRKLHSFIKDPEMIVPVSQIQTIQFQLRGVVQILRDISELRDVVDYNGYYDSII